MIKVGIINDTQIPFHDPIALDTALTLCQEAGVERMVLNGDMVDCYPISDFDRSPSLHSGLQREVDIAGQLLTRITADITDDVWWLGGNHEDRWRRLTWRIPVLHDLKALAFEKIFPIDELGVKWKPYGEWLDVGKLMVTHGHNYSAGATKGNFARYGQSVIVGHTHRLGTYYQTTRTGPHVSIENGCLCSLEPTWVQAANWQQGLTIVHLDPKTGYFNAQQVPILDRKTAFYGDRKIVGGSRRIKG